VEEGRRRRRTRGGGCCVQLRVGSLNIAQSQVRTTVVPEVPSSVRDDFGRCLAVFFNFGPFLLTWVCSPNTLDSQVPRLVRNII